MVVIGVDHQSTPVETELENECVEEQYLGLGALITKEPNLDQKERGIEAMRVNGLE